MSFSSAIKQELNKSSNLSNKEIVKFELIRISNICKYNYKWQANKVFYRK